MYALYSFSLSMIPSCRKRADTGHPHSWCYTKVKYNPFKSWLLSFVSWYVQHLTYINVAMGLLCRHFFMCAYTYTYGTTVRSMRKADKLTRSCSFLRLIFLKAALDQHVNVKKLQDKLTGSDSRNFANGTILHFTCGHCSVTVTLGQRTYIRIHMYIYIAPRRASPGRPAAAPSRDYSRDKPICWRSLLLVNGFEVCRDLQEHQTSPGPRAST